eukprot:TRINITY_DN3989_c0_g1_i1.p1 TRINITY_DN3989_c0_g1~~TRINITY_DN3989_c0_g1_i1.p1  ORF type:complete len:289 (+),score=39.69 TRINITY_DN3989_c0_g1_i1:39-905(+)
MSHDEDVMTAGYTGTVKKIMLQHSHVDSGWLEEDEVLPKHDSERWPDLSKAQGKLIEVNPGDILFIPSMYWHWVFSDEKSVAVQLFHNAPEELETPRSESKLSKTSTPPTSIDEARSVSQPILLGKAADHWPATQWDLDTVLTIPGLTRYVWSVGHSLCPIDKEHPYNKDTGYSSNEVDGLREKVFSNDGVNYQWTLPLTPASGGPLADIRIPPYIDPRTISNINIWCNTGRTHTGLHYDLQDNLLVGLKGRKRILLFPHSESKHLYHLPFDRDAVKSWKGARPPSSP